MTVSSSSKVIHSRVKIFIIRIATTDGFGHWRFGHRSLPYPRRSFAQLGRTGQQRPGVRMGT